MKITIGTPTGCTISPNSYHINLVGVQVDSSKIIATPPLTPTSPGIPGQIAFDDDYGYFCVATNRWKRWALMADTW